MDDVFGINMDDSFGTVDLDKIPGGAPPPPVAEQAAPPPPVQQAVSTIPEPIQPPPPPVQNVINVNSAATEAARSEAATTAQAPPPAPLTGTTTAAQSRAADPAFGSAPGRRARTRAPGAASTFLGSSALPARRAAAGGFGFDRQSSGSKTLIGT